MSRAPPWLSRSLIVGPFLTLCRTEGEFHAVLRHIKAPKPYPYFVGSGANATTHFVDTSRGLVAAVCVNLSKNSVEDAALLVHEAVHIWQHFRRDIGETNPSDEFEAYSIQSIAQQLLTAMKAGRK